jgi:3-oxoacyl-[acyl-carrier protein] reductase
MNILITGVSRGIGQDLLRLAVKSDEIKKIFACTSSKVISESGGKVEYYNVDFTDDHSIASLRYSLKDEKIHFLINNAGFLHQELYKNMDVMDAKKMFDINFWGPFELVKALLPNLIGGKGHVVNIGSMGGFQGSGKFSGLSAYSASKAALANLTECLAEEHKEDGVAFNCLALGAVDTQMLRKAFPAYKAGASSKAIASYIFNFTINSASLINGKVLPVSASTP